MKRTIEYKCKCKACAGTGIYVGLAERDGSGVVCHRCRGTGYREERIEYEDFDGRVKRGDVLRVFQSNPGIAIGVNKKRDLYLKSFGGMTYKDWAQNKSFPHGSEMRDFTCPAWWYQGVNYEKKPDWNECLGCGAFSSCENYSNKADCWTRWDKKYPTQLKQEKT